MVLCLQIGGILASISSGSGAMTVGLPPVVSTRLLTHSPLLPVYQHYGVDTISIVPFVSGHPQLYSANLAVARQVVGGGIKSVWIKPERLSGALL